MNQRQDTTSPNEICSRANPSLIRQPVLGRFDSERVCPTGLSPRLGSFIFGGLPFCYSLPVGNFLPARRGSPPSTSYSRYRSSRALLIALSIFIGGRNPVFRHTRKIMQNEASTFPIRSGDNMERLLCLGDPFIRRN